MLFFHNRGVALACLAALGCNGHEFVLSEVNDTQVAGEQDDDSPIYGEVSEPGMPAEGCYLLSGEPYGPVRLSRITDTGLKTELKIDNFEIHTVHGLTWFDDVWYACNNHVIRIDPETSTASETNIPCHAIGRWGGDLALTTPSGTALAYASEEDLFDDNPSAEFEIGMQTISRGAIIGYELYGAWHSTDTVEVQNLHTGAQRTVSLQGFNTWVWGVGIEHGLLVVLDDGRADNSHAVSKWSFNTFTGHQLDRVPVSDADDWGTELRTGLWCSPGPADL